jgi:hypothetical protein
MQEKFQTALKSKENTKQLVLTLDPPFSSWCRRFWQVKPTGIHQGPSTWKTVAQTVMKAAWLGANFDGQNS